MSAYDCIVYVNASTREEVLALVADVVGGDVDHFTVSPEFADIDVRDNDDSHPDERTAFPDGFLHFDYRVEVYPHGEDRGIVSAQVARLLRALWQRGWPAVAACDYEDDLPSAGGYGDPSLPWPSQGGG